MKQSLGLLILLLIFYSSPSPAERRGSRGRGETQDGRGGNGWWPGWMNSTDLDMSYFNGDRDAIRTFRTLRRKIKSGQHRDSMTAIDRALAFYARNKERIKCQGPRTAQQITNEDYIVVNDFTKPDDQKRQLIINLKTGDITATYVPHGYGSSQPISACPEGMVVKCKLPSGEIRQRCKVPVKFTNEEGRGTTLTGFFTTAEQYRSSQSTFNQGTPSLRPPASNAVRVEGLQNGVNETARATGKVWHRAAYADKSNPSYACSNTAGCPAAPPEVFEYFKDKIDKGALMYNHTFEEETKSKPDC